MTESTTNLKAHFKSFQEFNYLDQDKNKITKVESSRGTSKIVKRNNEFIDSMIEDSKKRLEFMESIQKIKEDKIQRAYSDHSKVYNFINQSRF